MKYMVVECHTAYAVVLDENGRFIKVANLHYEVGQTVTDVVEMNLPESKPVKKFNTKWIYSIAAAAACFLFVFIPMLFMNGTTAHASVYMTINPQVRIDVNEDDEVILIEAVNADGEELISDYSYKNKKLEIVLDELVDLAIEKGYLREGGKITLTLDTEDNEWVVNHSEALNTHVNSHLTDKINEVTVVVEDKNASDSSSLIEESAFVPDDNDDDEYDDDDEEFDDIDDDIDDDDESDDIDDDDESDDIDDESDDIDDDDESDDIDDDNDFDGENDREDDDDEDDDAEDEDDDIDDDNDFGGDDDREDDRDDDDDDRDDD